MYTVLYYPQTNQIQVANVLRNNLVYTKSTYISRFIFSDMSGAYECINPEYMSEFIKQVKEGQLSTDMENINQLVTLTEESNPVIFYYEYKE